MMNTEDIVGIMQGLNYFQAMYEFFLEKNDYNVKLALELTRIWRGGIMNAGGNKK